MIIYPQYTDEMIQYATEIEKKLNSLRSHNIDWYHDLEGGGGSYYEITNTTNLYYYVLHSEVKMDDRILLESISNDAMEFHRVFNVIGWQSFEKFDSSTYSLKRMYKINIQCILTKSMFEEDYKVILARDGFMKLINQKFKSDTYNLSQNTALQKIRQNLLEESFLAIREKNGQISDDEDFYNPYDLGGYL